MNVRNSPHHRLLQVFLSVNGVFEVYVNMRKKTYACTCPGYRARGWCKHCEAVGEKSLREHGSYTVAIADGGAPLNDDIMLDAHRFREWVIHNARVEVLQHGEG